MDAFRWGFTWQGFECMIGHVVRATHLATQPPCGYTEELELLRFPGGIGAGVTHSALRIEYAGSVFLFRLLGVVGHGGFFFFLCPVGF